MAALVLSVAGGAAGAVFGPAGAIAGRIAGALAGNIIDRSLFAEDRSVQGPRLADLDVLPSSPSLAFDMAGALLEAVVSEVGMEAEQAMLVRTAFVDEGRVVEAALFFAPDPGSLSVILGRLGVG